LKLKPLFIILRSMDGRAAGGPTRCGRLVRAMTRCECSETPFAEVVRRLRTGEDLDAIQAETGVGLLCTACLPDLREQVAEARRDVAQASAEDSEPVDPAA
jgi:bacterioferritin-associated ferredoxin